MCSQRFWIGAQRNPLGFPRYSRTGTPLKCGACSEDWVGGEGSCDDGLASRWSHTYGHSVTEIDESLVKYGDEPVCVWVDPG